MKPNTLVGQFALACMAVSAISYPSQAAHWPGFRGLAAQGVSMDAKPPIHFNASSNLLWKADVSPGLSSPVIWDNHIFLTAAADKELITLCLDRQTGKPRWEQRVPASKWEPVHSANSRATPTPVTDGKRVFSYFGSIGLLAYDFNGKEVWRKPLPTPKTFQNQGTGTSPILADGKLIVFLQVGNDSHLLAVDPADGHDVWKAAMPVHNNTYSTPVTWQEDGKAFVGLTCAARFTAFSAADGKEVWWVNDIAPQACSTPLVQGDRLILATAGMLGESANITPPPSFDVAVKQFGAEGGESIPYKTIPKDLLYTDRRASGGQGNMTLRQALRFFGGVKEGDDIPRQKWEEIRERLTGFATSKANQTVVLCVHTGGKEEVTASRLVWKESRGVPEVPSPLLLQDRLYFVRSGGLLVCRDFQTGKLIYEGRLNSPGGYYASPVAGGEHIYFASDSGTLTVIKGGKDLEVVARNELGEPIIASPAIVNSTLYVRSAGHLWAFGNAAQ